LLIDPKISSVLASSFLTPFYLGLPIGSQISAAQANDRMDMPETQLPIGYEISPAQAVFAL